MRNNPLFFRTDGSLDFGPAILAVACGVGLVMFVLDGFGVADVSTAAYAWLGGFTGLAFIAGAAAERAYWIAQSKTPGELAQGVAQAGPDIELDPETMWDRSGQA